MIYQLRVGVFRGADPEAWHYGRFPAVAARMRLPTNGVIVLAR